MRELSSLLALVILCGCSAAPQITKKETSASVFVSTSTLEINAIHPDETIFVRVFTPEQSIKNDRPLSVTTLNPKKPDGTFWLDSGTRYKIQLLSMNSGSFSSSSCLAMLDLTPSANSSYQILFSVNEPDEKCLLIFKSGDKELVKNVFAKNKTYRIPIPIPVSL